MDSYVCSTITKNIARFLHENRIKCLLPGSVTFCCDDVPSASSSTSTFWGLRCFRRCFDDLKLREALVKLQKYHVDFDDGRQLSTVFGSNKKINLRFVGQMHLMKQLGSRKMDMVLKAILN